MGRVPKKLFSDAVKSSFTEGMYFGHDQRGRRVKHSPGMLYRLAEDPNYQNVLDELQAWLESQGIGKVRPIGMGAERAVFEDGDRVVKVGLEHRAVGDPDYTPPEGVWGVTPWLGKTSSGPFRMEIQPRVNLVDTGGMMGTQEVKGRRKPNGSDIRLLQDALARQGWYWQDNHIGNIGFVPGSEYMPTVIDGPVHPSSLSVVPGEKQPGTVPSVFVPPTRPAWAYGTLAALLAGSNSAKADTATAGTEESLIDYLRRMVPANASEPSPGQGSGYFSADAFTTAPEHPPMLRGTAPLSEYSSDFPEMEQYRQLASKAFNTARVIREGDQTMTPAEYMIFQQESALGIELSESERRYLVDTVEPYLTGQALPDDTPASDAAKRVLEKLKAQSLGGNEEVFPGQTLEQREKRRTGPMQEGRYMTSEGMDKNLAATRVFNLLSATQTDPGLSPDTASNVSAALSGLGAAFAYPVAAFSGGLQGEDNFLGKETIDMAQRRIGTALANPLRARIQEALYQDQKAQEGEDLGQYKTGLGGGFYPQTQVTSGVGMAEQLNYDNANLNTMLSSTVLPQAFSGTPMIGSEDSPTLRNLASNLGREVPILPPGLSAEEADAARRDLRSYLDSQERQFINEYPVKQRKWNETAIGQLWPAKQYSFPSPLTNAAATSWKYWLDPMTIGTLGVGATAGAVRGGGGALIRTLASGAKDFVRDTATFEMPATAAMYSSQQGMSPGDLIKPMQASDVVDEEGNPARPDDPRYEFYLGQHQDRQKKLLGRLIDFGKKWYPAPKPQMPSGDGAEYTESLSYH